MKTTPKTTFHKKSWGSELWIHNGPDYTFKILAFRAYHQGSLHYHLQKTETWFVESGQFNLLTVDPVRARHTVTPLAHGSVVHLPAGTAHQLLCTRAGRIFEASTPHAETDTYRIFPSRPSSPFAQPKTVQPRKSREK